MRYIATAISNQELPRVNADAAQLQVILSTFFGILAAIAFITIIIAGLRYINSTGDPSTTVKARNTIIYAGIGLIVSISAFAIVGFVLNNL